MPNALITIAGSSEPTSVPHFELTPADASLLRDYVSWMVRHDIRNELRCRQCYEENNAPGPIEVTNDGRLGICCTHQLITYADIIPASSRLPAVLEAPSAEIELVGAGQVIVKLDQWEAELLRAYDKFLARYRLVEGYRCNPCWDKGFHPGVRAKITPSAIDIHCRHRHLVYRGTTE